MFDYLAVLDPGAGQAALVERIAQLERAKSAAAAGQARAAAALDAMRRAAEATAGMPGGRRGRGVAGEIALARRDSPARGNRHLGFAKALVHEMPHTLAALACGALTEWRATLIVRESACLDVTDETLLGGADDAAEISGYGPIPATVARTLITTAATDARSRATLRRLYAHPATGALVTMQSRARIFPRALATFIALRDGRCRTPY